MLPPAISGMLARSEADCSKRASRVLRLATNSTMWQNWPLASASRTGLNAMLFPQFFSDQFRSSHHGLELRKSHISRQVEAATIGQDEETLRGHHLKGFVNMLGHDGGRLHFRGLDVDHAYA